MGKMARVLAAALALTTTEAPAAPPDATGAGTQVLWSESELPGPDGTAAEPTFHGLTATPDGGVLALGRIVRWERSANAEKAVSEHAVLLRFDAAGTLLWRREAGDERPGERAIAAVPAIGGGTLLLSSGWTPRTGLCRLRRLGETGALLADHRFDEPGTACWHLLAAADGGAWLARHRPPGRDDLLHVGRGGGTDAIALTTGGRLAVDGLWRRPNGGLVASAAFDDGARLLTLDENGGVTGIHPLPGAASPQFARGALAGDGSLLGAMVVHPGRQLTVMAAGLDGDKPRRFSLGQPALPRGYPLPPLETDEPVPLATLPDGDALAFVRVAAAEGNGWVGAIRAVRLDGELRRARPSPVVDPTPRPGALVETIPWAAVTLADGSVVLAGSTWVWRQGASLASSRRAGDWTVTDSVTWLRRIVPPPRRGS